MYESDAFSQLALEKDRHRQTIEMLVEIRAAWCKEFGEDFRFNGFPNEPRPSFLRRVGRVVWPFRKWVS